MSTTAVRPAPADERAILRQLAGLHMKRYASHPLYLMGVALLIPTTIQMSDDGPRDWEAFTTPAAVAFFVGVLGVIVGYRITVTEGRALGLLEAAPTQTSTRTLALCAACLVPMATGAAWFVVRMVTWVAWPMRQEMFDSVGGWIPVAAVALAGSAVAATGGPLVGIATARWLRFPGAGVLAAITLVVTSMILAGAAVGPSTSTNPVLLAGASATPFTLWSITDYVDDIGNFIGIREGSPVGHLLYATTLCGLAVWAAVMKDAVGATRAQWKRIGAALGFLAIATYLWAWLG